MTTTKDARREDFDRILTEDVGRIHGRLDESLVKPMWRIYNELCDVAAPRPLKRVRLVNYVADKKGGR